MEIDGCKYQLDRNFLNNHHLHGGHTGIGEKVWRIERANSNSVRLMIEIPDGDMGYPGTLQVRADISLLGDGVLDIQYQATTSSATLCNIAHHSYFNLGDTQDVLNHELQVDAQQYLPVDNELIPTGEIALVADTTFDLREFRSLRSMILSNPIDHNYCVSNSRGPIRTVARLRDKDAGLKMDIRTTEPGLQVYDGCLLNVPVTGVDGRQIGAYAGIALEPQVWPDSPNNPQFPQALLQPSKRYEQHTQYIFSKDLRQ